MENNLICDDEEKYILSYKVEGEKIMIKWVGGKTDTIPYTKENEQSVIMQIKTQIRNAKAEPLSIFEKIENTMEKILAISQPLVLPKAISNFINYGGFTYDMVLIAVIGGAIVYPAKWIKNSIKKRHIKQLNRCLAHCQESTEHLEDNKKVASKARKKTTHKIKQTPVEEVRFDINNLDDYSLSDLKTLRESLERFVSPNFNGEKDISEKPTQMRQGPVLQKKYDFKKK